MANKFVVMGTCGGGCTDAQVWPVCYFDSMIQAEDYVVALHQRSAKFDNLYSGDLDDPYSIAPSEEELEKARLHMKTLDPWWQTDWASTMYYVMEVGKGRLPRRPRKAK